MRSFLSALLTIIAVVLAAVAGPLIWVQLNLVDRDGFATLAEPVGSDTEFQEQLSAALAETAGDKVQGVPFMSGLTKPLVEKAAQNLTSDPAYPDAWTETLLRSHATTMVDPRANANDPGTLSLDVSPMVGLALEKVSGGLFSAEHSPQHVFVQIGSERQRTVALGLADASRVGVWLALGAVLSFVLALLSARRRSTVLIATGIGGLLVAGAWFLTTVLLVFAADHVDASEHLAAVFDAKFASIVQDNFNVWVIVALGASLAALVGGGIGRASRSSRKLNT